MKETLSSILFLINSGNPSGSDVTFADLLEHAGIRMNLLSSQDSESEGNLLLHLAVLVVIKHAFINFFKITKITFVLKHLQVQNLTLEGIIRLRTGQWEPISHLRRPLQEFLQYSFPNTSTEALQEQAAERLLSQLRPRFQNLFASEEEVNIRNGSRIDICATVEALLRRHIKDILQFLFNNGL